MIPYRHAAELLFTRPWALLDEPGGRRPHSLYRSLLAEHIRHGHLAADEIEARIAAAQRTVRASAPATVARIPILGPIIPRASMFAEMSGATSVESIRGAFRAAVNDPEIDAIVFDIDSPGGIVDQVPELAAEIRGARGRKPMAAVANTIAASAAYWLASQTDELVVTPSGEVGSIGVFSAHEDASKFWDEIGIKTTLISAGKFKTEGNEFEPLGDEARAHFQALVDDYYAMFVRDVAAGRNDTAAAVRAGYGQGRMLTPKRALEAKLADRIDTLEATEMRMARQGALQRAERGRQAAIALPAGAARAQLDQPLVPDEVPIDTPPAEEPPPEAPVEDVPVETPDPDTDDPVAAAPSAEWYALRARRRDRA